VQDLDVQTRNEMLKAISDQGLSVQQYRQALQRAQTNSTLSTAFHKFGDVY